MIHYDDPTLYYIEDEIRYIYHKDVTGYPQSEFLLDVRRRLLNDQALTRESQEELLPHIIAFNDALRDALKHMYDRAHELYFQMSAIVPDIELLHYIPIRVRIGKAFMMLYAIPVGTLCTMMEFLSLLSFLTIWKSRSNRLSAWTARLLIGMKV